MNHDLRLALASMGNAMATWAGDWSKESRLAWVYGIACGWDEASLAELQAKHGWSDDTVACLRRYHGAVADLIQE